MHIFFSVSTLPYELPKMDHQKISVFITEMTQALVGCALCWLQPHVMLSKHERSLSAGIFIADYGVRGAVLGNGTDRHR